MDVQPEMLSRETVLIRATAIVTSEVEAGAEAGAAAAMNRTLTFALCTGFLILVASLVSVFVWYGVIADPGEILRKAAVRAAGGSAAAAMPAANGLTTAHAPEVVQYVGIPQTFLPGDLNRGSQASVLPTANLSFATSVGSLTELALQENGTDNTALPAPL
ncbi:uncharacterized protein [Dermacentor albipictus]|uniref:uncharacterized protein n=1 Tax=Dermacentor albipictus TaxID=60249 RepID=UPI0031FE295F